MLSYIIPFLILILVVVFIHEYGHYYFARKYGVGVTDFSIGFGKELFGWDDKYGTRWKVCAIPLGGYVKFFGDRNVYSQADHQEILDKYNEEERDKLFILKPLYQRVLIVFGGPLANFLLALVIFFSIYTFIGKDFTPAVINEVQKDSPAMVGGLKAEDIILEIDGNEVKSIMEVSKFITMSTGDFIDFKVKRSYDELILKVKPNVVEGDDGFVVPNFESEELQVNVQVFRYDCLEGESGTDEWACVLPGNMSVLQLLRTVKATEDGSLTFRDGPANDPCTVISVNGRNVLPGLTKISDIASSVNGSWKIVIEPLPGGEVIRDLVVDLSIHDIKRSSLKPWFHSATRDGIELSQGVIGSMSSSEATEIHKIRDFTSAVLVDSFSDTLPYNESYIGPSNVVSLWSRVIDPRTSDKNRIEHMKSLSSVGGIKAETDLSSISRNGELGMKISSHMLDAKTSVLRDGAFSDSRHGKHVWWYCWSVKMSGKVNDAVIYRQVLGPIGLISNLTSGISARMMLGFTRTGGRVFNGLLGMIAPPAGVGKMPKQFNTPVNNHHEVVAIYNEIGSGF